MHIAYFKEKFGKIPPHKKLLKELKYFEDNNKIHFKKRIAIKLSNFV